jgi:DNA-binding CsgD family transcriptional regulator
MKENLSPRQQELFNLLINGVPPKEIAFNLNITYNTLLFHQKKLYRNLDVHNVQELIARYSTEAKEAVQETAPESGTITIHKSALFVIWGILLGLICAVVLLFILYFR